METDRWGAGSVSLGTPFSIAILELFVKFFLNSRRCYFDTSVRFVGPRRCEKCVLDSLNPLWYHNVSIPTPQGEGVKY